MNKTHGKTVVFFLTFNDEIIIHNKKIQTYNRNIIVTIDNNEIEIDGPNKSQLGIMKY